MQIDIHTKNVDLNAPLRTFIEEKMGDVERFLGKLDPVHMRVEVGIPSQHHQSGPIYYAEANLTIGGDLLRADSQNYDLHTAIVDVKDELRRQVKDYKERLRDKRRKPKDR